MLITTTATAPSTNYLQIVRYSNNTKKRSKWQYSRTSICYRLSGADAGGRGEITKKQKRKEEKKAENARLEKIKLCRDKREEIKKRQKDKIAEKREERRKREEKRRDKRGKGRDKRGEREREGGEKEERRKKRKEKRKEEKRESQTNSAAHERGLIANLTQVCYSYFIKTTAT